MRTAMLLDFLLMFEMLAAPVSASGNIVSQCEFSHDEPFDEQFDLYIVLFAFCFKIEDNQLRVRCYNPCTLIGTQPDPHWNVGNMIWGSDPMRMNEREDHLGVNRYTMMPDIWAIMQSGNLYVYCVNNPIMFQDPSGEFIITLTVLVVVGGKLVLKAAAGAKVVTLATGAAASKGAIMVGGKVVRGSAIVANIAGAASVTKVGDQVKNIGFNSFRQLKNYIGSAGRGNVWHHIVQQCQIRKSGFSANLVHSTQNVVNLTRAQHIAVEKIYSGKIDGLTNGLIFRDWLAGQSFEAQYRWGLWALREAGVVIP